MYCDFCGAMKSRPDVACDNCGTQPDTLEQEASYSYTNSNSDYGVAKKSGLPTWAVVLISLGTGLVLVVGLSFSGILNSLNPLAGPVEDSELNVLSFGSCAEREGYIGLTESVYDTFAEQSNLLDGAFGFSGQIDALRTSGAAFVSLGKDFSEFPHCGSLTFYENNQDIADSLNRMGTRLSELPEDSSELEEISTILSDVEVLLTRVEGDLGVQRRWFERFVDF